MNYEIVFGVFGEKCQDGNYLPYSPKLVLSVHDEWLLATEGGHGGKLSSLIFKSTKKKEGK